MNIIFRLHTCLGFFVFLNVTPYSGQDASVRFELQVNGQNLEVGEPYFIAGLHDSIRIDMFRFYISRPASCELGVSRPSDIREYILVDAELEESQVIFYQADNKSESLGILLGIDSVMSCSGAHGGDLDPVHGMYWSWQSGYINVKLEGRSQACDTRHHRFQYHFGGYAKPFACAEWLTFDLDDNPETVIEVDLGLFFSQISLSENPTIMSPGRESVTASKVLASTFTIRK